MTELEKQWNRCQKKAAKVLRLWSDEKMKYWYSHARYYKIGCDDRDAMGMAIIAEGKRRNIQPD